MSRYIRTYKTGSGATAVQIVTKQGRATVAIKHVGSAHGEHDLKLLMAAANQSLMAGQTTLFCGPDSKELTTIATHSRLLYDTIATIYDQLGFDSLDDNTFKQLVIARIIKPTSKLETINVISALGLVPPSNTKIHRCLRQVIEHDFRSQLSACCFKQASPHSLSLLLYDVTTLYFEVQKEDGYRKPGMSKERRLEPQITVGLLVGRDGFPLEIASFEGNKAEVKTIMEVLETFKGRYGLEDVTVTADAAMLSSKNIQALEDAGYHYIIGSRIAKTPYEIAEFAKKEGEQLKDSQIFDTHQLMNTGTGSTRISRRVIYQYRSARASLDLSNIDKLLAKAQKMVAGSSEFKRNRFLKVSGSKKEINYALVESSRLRAGIKGYVTDLDAPAQEIIAAYHQLFEVERSFRMAKSDLKARPIFHHRRDSIEAHLTIVFAALAISRRIQATTGLSIRKFVRTLKPLRDSVIEIDGEIYCAKTSIPDTISSMLEKLGA